MDAMGALLPILAFFVAWWTLKVNRESREFTYRALQHANMDWVQGKWFDLYFKADQACNALERYQTVYQHSNPAIPSVAQMNDHNHLMYLIREAYTMASVFPKNVATDALL
jgi:hypothetical protein